MNEEDLKGCPYEHNNSELICQSCQDKGIFLKDFTTEQANELGLWGKKLTVPNNTFREEDKAIIIGGIVMSCGNILNENAQEISAKVGEYMISEMEKQIHDSHKRLLEEISKIIEAEPSNNSYQPLVDFKVELKAFINQTLK